MIEIQFFPPDSLSQACRTIVLTIESCAWLLTKEKKGEWFFHSVRCGIPISIAAWDRDNDSATLLYLYYVTGQGKFDMTRKTSASRSSVLCKIKKSTGDFPTQLKKLPLPRMEPTYRRSGGSPVFFFPMKLR